MPEFMVAIDHIIYYAVRAEDVYGCSEEEPARLQRAGEPVLPAASAVSGIEQIQALLVDAEGEMVPVVRIERTTYRLQGGCSTN